MPGGLKPGLGEFAGVARRPEPPVKVGRMSARIKSEPFILNIGPQHPSPTASSA